MKYNFNLLNKQIRKILCDDYNHESPWLLINRSLYREFKRFFNAELKKLTNGEIVIDNFSGSWTSLSFFLKFDNEQAYEKDCHACVYELGCAKNNIPKCEKHLSKENTFVYISLDWQCFSATVLRLIEDRTPVLYRTASNLKDYTGGSNNFCKLSEVIEKAVELMRKECD